MPNVTGKGLTPGNFATHSKKRRRASSSGRLAAAQHATTGSRLSVSDTSWGDLEAAAADAAAAAIRTELRAAFDEYESPLASLVAWLEDAGRAASALSEAARIAIERKENGRFVSVIVYDAPESRLRRGGARRGQGGGGDGGKVFTLKRMASFGSHHGAGAACMRRFVDRLRLSAPAGYVVVEDVACMRRAAGFYERCGFRSTGTRVRPRLVYELSRRDARAHCPSQRGELKRLA